MALSNEDKKDVAGAFGKKAASAVSRATQDHKPGTFKRVGSVGGNPLAPVFRYKEPSAKSKAIGKKIGSIEGINKARKEQGYKPKKFDAASRGLHSFLDKYD